MKGQDIVVALGLTQEAKEDWSYGHLSGVAGLSPAGAHASVERLRLAGLIAPEGWVVRRSRLIEFLVHGLPYVFPVRLGAETIGVPTATAHSSVSALLGLGAGPSLVWPHAGGAARGASVKPLYPTVPRIALLDERLHELLALVDCLRLGRARERAAAAKHLQERLAS